MIGKILIAVVATAIFLGGLAGAALLVIIRWVETHPQDYTIDDGFDE